MFNVSCLYLVKNVPISLAWEKPSDYDLTNVNPQFLSH